MNPEEHEGTKGHRGLRGCISYVPLLPPVFRIKRMRPMVIVLSTALTMS
jgi:hypothetical protein